MRFDIMMPFWGDVDQFKQAVLSVISQSDPSWRLVVIDDRYPDPEPSRFLSTIDDSRIEYVLNDVNLGVSGNFRRSVDLSRADLVVIMGCDDRMLPEYVATMRDAFDAHPNADYVQPGVDVIDDTGRRRTSLGDRVKAAQRPRAAELSGEQLAASLLRGNWTYFPSICWRRSTLVEHPFRPDYGVVLDLALQLEIVSAGGTMLLVDDLVFEYRRHRSSASSWSGGGRARLEEEASLFAESAEQAADRGWGVASRAARTHWSSRLNAVAQMPRALLDFDRVGVRAIARHAFSRVRRA